jgi:molybdopterin-guanine dinucleotide biosynthesis protein A
MGGLDKVMVPFEGRSSLDRLLAAAPDAATVVVVGPARRSERTVTWCREEPPGGGPLAAVAAALPRTTSDAVIVAAGDMPMLGEVFGRLEATLAEHGDAEVAALVDADGVRQPLAAAYRRDALERLLSGLGEPANLPARLLLAGLSVIEVVGGRAAMDCDTWDDAERISGELRRPGGGGSTQSL